MTFGWGHEPSSVPPPPTWRDLVAGVLVVAAYLLLLGHWLVSDARVIDQVIARVVWGQ